MEKVVIVLNKYKKIIIIALIVLIIVIIGILVFNRLSRKVSEIERIKIEEVSNEVINYIDFIEENKEDSIDKYIMYALKYEYNEHNTSKVSSTRIKEIISNTFNKEITIDDIKNCGITSLLLDNNVTYDSSDESYSYHIDNLSLSDIAENEIKIYELIDIKKIKKDEFEVTYDKYVISNPYEVLNYYNDYNINNSIDSFTDENGQVISVDTGFEPYNTDEILAYLKGTEKERTLRKHINKDLLDVIGNKKYSIKITYKVIDKKILIEEIKK